MKTILVPTSGTETDTSVFATALALARSAHAHLEFYHLRLDPCEAALRDPRAQFCIGPAISATLSSLERRDSALSSNDPGELLLFHARHSDLTVLGRRHTLDLMPENLLKELKPDELRDLFSYLQSEAPPGPMK